MKYMRGVCIYIIHIYIYTHSIRPYTPLKFNIASDTCWLEDYFPFGKVTFQGRTVKPWGGISYSYQDVARHCNVTCHFRDLFDLPCVLIRSSINFSEGGFDKSRVSIFFSCSNKLTYLILELDLCNYDNDVPLLFAEWLNGSIKIPELQILFRYMSMIHSDESNKPIQQATSRNEPSRVLISLLAGKQSFE